MGLMSIRTKLFIAITIFVTLIISSMTYFYYYKTSTFIWNRAEANSMQTLKSLTTSMDQTIRDLDRISAQVVFDSNIYEFFLKSRLFPNTFESIAQRKVYEDILRSINYPWLIAKNISLFNLKGNFIKVGISSDTSLDPAQSGGFKPWIQKTIDKDGDKLLTVPHENYQELNRSFFSLSRCLCDKTLRHIGVGIVEVQQSYDKLQQLVEEGLPPSSHYKAYIFDDDGDIFFPVDSTDSQTILPFDRKLTHNRSGYLLQIENKISHSTDVLSYLHSQYTGLTIAISQPRSLLLQPIHQLRWISILIACFAIFIALLLAFFIASKITSPIQFLQKYVRKLDLENLSVLPMNKMMFSKEIFELSQAFSIMNLRLNQSMNQLLEANYRENMAQIHAIQAQMNPHFLYNTLTIIGLRAKELKVSELYEMCHKLASMLRYISQPALRQVKLQEEYQHVVSYLELMQYRYEGNLSYEIDLDSELENITVPMLILQPLVENSFIHGFKNVLPPYHVSVSIHTSDMEVIDWIITIQDNGIGFDSDNLTKVQKIIDRLHSETVIQLRELSFKAIGGLGLENTLTRYRLFWGNRVGFQIRNLVEGMEITIMIYKENAYVSHHDC